MRCRGRSSGTGHCSLSPWLLSLLSLSLLGPSAPVTKPCMLQQLQLRSVGSLPGYFSAEHWDSGKSKSIFAGRNLPPWLQSIKEITVQTHRKGAVLLLVLPDKQQFRIYSLQISLINKVKDLHPQNCSQKAWNEQGGTCTARSRILADRKPSTAWFG